MTSPKFWNFELVLSTEGIKIFQIWFRLLICRQNVHNKCRISFWVSGWMYVLGCIEFRKLCDSQNLQVDYDAIDPPDSENDTQNFLWRHPMARVPTIRENQGKFLLIFQSGKIREFGWKLPKIEKIRQISGRIRENQGIWQSICIMRKKASYLFAEDRVS